MRNAGSLLSLHQVGRRRGGNKLALKTGVVAKKQKTDEEVKMGGERGAVTPPHLRAPVWNGGHPTLCWDFGPDPKAMGTNSGSFLPHPSRAVSSAPISPPPLLKFKLPPSPHPPWCFQFLGPFAPPPPPYPHFSPPSAPSSPPIHSSSFSQCSPHYFPPPLPPFSQVLTSKGDAWAKYMAEVKKYKAHQCSDDDKTRPLVK